jgi:hypothetical protein
MGSVTARRALLVVLLAVGPAHAEPFSHAALDRVLQRFVDDQGRVDYAGLGRERADLDAYLRRVAAASPDRHPDAFPTRADALAYWANAYNAAVIGRVLDDYPIASIAEASLLGKTGFFTLTRPDLGGRRTSLYELEHGVIRKGFGEPRVHFALNCASRGCPRLPREAFDGARLDAQLDRETRRFLAEERNLRVDHAARTVWLSAILDWYADDFTDAYRARTGRAGTVLDWMRPYLDEPRAAEVERAGDYRVRFFPYDWRLNDRVPGED